MTTPQRGGFFMIAAFAFGVILNYAYNIVMARILPVAEFGVLNYLFALAGIAVLGLSAGFPYVLMRRMGQGDADPGRVLRATALGNLALGTLAAIGLVAADALGLLRLGPEHAGSVLALVAVILLASLGLIMRALLQARLKLAYVSLSVALETASKVFVGAALVMAGVGVAGALAAVALGSLLTIILSLLVVRDFPYLAWRGWSDRDSYRLVGPMFAGVASAHVLVTLDTIGLKWFAPADSADEYVGFYGAGMTFARVPVYLAGAMVGAVFPYLANSAGDVARVRRLVAKLVKYSLVFFLPIVLAFVIAAEEIILLFFPAPYAAGAPAVAIAAVAMLLLALLLEVAAVFQAAVRPFAPAAILGVAAVVELALLAGLTPRFGMVGAALAVLATTAAALVILGWMYVRAYGAGFRIRPALAIAGAAIAFAIVLLVFPRSGPLSLLAGLTLASAAYMVVGLRAGAFTTEDAHILVSSVFSPESAIGRRMIMAFAWLSATETPGTPAGDPALPP